jgi:hypothetical protein
VIRNERLKADAATEIHGMFILLPFFASHEERSLHAVAAAEQSDHAAASDPHRGTWLGIGRDGVKTASDIPKWSLNRHPRQKTPDQGTAS